jgi:hypothetical protein
VANEDASAKMVVKVREINVKEFLEQKKLQKREEELKPKRDAAKFGTKTNVDYVRAMNTGFELETEDEKYVDEIQK